MKTIGGVAIPGQRHFIVKYRTCERCERVYRKNHTCHMETPEWQRKQALEQRLREAQEPNTRGMISAETETARHLLVTGENPGLTTAIHVEGDCNGCT